MKLVSPYQEQAGNILIPIHLLQAFAAIYVGNFQSF